MKKLVIRKFDKLSFGISVAIGLIWGIIGNALYKSMIDKLWTPLFIGMWFLVLAINLFLVIRFCGFIRNDNVSLKSNGLPTLLLFVCIFAAATIFEILYEINFSKPKDKTPTSYIFLIDDSASMSSNDPTDQRIDAIFSVISQCDADFPVCVYKFTSNCNCILEMQNASQVAVNYFDFKSDGGTDIVNAIRNVLSDIDSNSIYAGDAPKLLLFSDGESSSSGMVRTLRKALKMNITISTVGFGNASEQYLKNISSKTGGAYVYIDDINQLGDALQDAAQGTSENTRNLLSQRIFCNPNIVYAIMRVVFLLLLCLAGVVLKAMLFCTKALKNKAVLFGVAFSAAGAVMMEIGLEILNYNENLMRIVLCVCFMALTGTVEIVKYQKTEDEEYAPYYNTAENDSNNGNDNLEITVRRQNSSNSLIGKKSDNHDEFDV